MNAPKASIVILDFLKSKRVVENVESIQKQRVSFPIEIIVVDNSNNVANAEKLRELKRFENVKLVFNKVNLGYTRGINRGVIETSGEFIFIVNPDIVWSSPDVIAELVDFLEKNPDVGVVAPRQIRDTDKQTEMTIRAFPKLSNQIARRTFLRKLPIIRKRVAYDEMQHLDYSKIQEVDWLQSSFWAVPRDLWEKLDGLDERFFLFMSDPDFCRRVWESGKKVVYFPKVVVNADGERCSAGGFTAFFKKWTLRQHLRDAWKYYKKWRGKKNPRG
ncbi:MAG: glycosyltransferase family 2 protein [Candidatus Peribacteraceae bacterium]|nr:glycosyltransferase family 2 protein [Candidatus Peribacteraceae bacterium]